MIIPPIDRNVCETILCDEQSRFFRNDVDRFVFQLVSFSCLFLDIPVILMHNNELEDW